MTDRRTYDFSTGNLVLDQAGNIKTVDDLEALRQKIVEKMQFLRGSWDINTTIGVPYKTEVLKKPVDAGLVVALFNSTITAEPDVIRILSVSANLDPGTRKFTYRASVLSTYGELEVTA